MMLYIIYCTLCKLVPQGKKRVTILYWKGPYETIPFYMATGKKKGKC